MVPEGVTSFTRTCSLTIKHCGFCTISQQIGYQKQSQKKQENGRTTRFEGEKTKEIYLYYVRGCMRGREGVTNSYQTFYHDVLDVAV